MDKTKRLLSFVFPIKIYDMKQRVFFFTFFLFLTFSAFSEAKAQTPTAEGDSDKLVIVWTSDDPYLAERMILMYTHGAKTAGWFNEVTMIIWGPSAKMVSENLEIQKKLKAMQEDGVELLACIACAREYGVVEDLRNLDIEVKGMGKPLSDYLKGDASVMTF